jgi:hypothetical protein
MMGQPANLLSAVEAAEGAGTKERHEKNSRAERNNLPDTAQAEVAYANHELVTDNKIEQSPPNIHGRRGQPFSRRFRERALERSS